MTENHNKTLSPELKEKLSKIKHLALDMDGTTSYISRDENGNLLYMNESGIPVFI